MKQRRIVRWALGAIAALTLVGATLVASPHQDQAVAGAPTGVAATMADYWNGDAEWVFKKLDSKTTTGFGGYYESASVRVGSDGTWYLFNRLVDAVSPECAGILQMSIRVRSSTDEGATWSSPVEVVGPTAGTPWECAATDGAPYYNAVDDKWVLMFQCYDGSWNGCYAERAGSDPMGAFTATTTVSITGGQVWDMICDDPADDCSTISGGVGRVYDEGTFDIFDFDGTYYWVTFHGYDGMANGGNGYRGIAKTADFVNWIAGDATLGTPEDAVFDAYDSDIWRETWDGGSSIGGGHAAMYKEGSNYYMLVEGADRDLGCTWDQRWDFGLYRSTSLTSTTWSTFPQGNPIIYSSTESDDWPSEPGEAPPCSVQYTTIFEDPTTGFIWMAYGRVAHNYPDVDGLYWFRLEKSENLLQNADFWRADFNSWNISGSTNYAVWRHPSTAYDGTPYLATNCGGTCGVGTNSVYQDVAVTPSGQTTVDSAARMYLESGSGSATIVIWQFNSVGATLRNDQVVVTPGAAWTNYTLGDSLDPLTRTIRYQIYLSGTATYKIDDVSLTIQ